MRKRAVLISVVTTLLACTAVALAYYILNFTFSGEGSSPNAKAVAFNESITITPPKLAPGETGVVADTIKPTKVLVLEPGAKLAHTVTTSNEATCKASWFVLENTFGNMSEELMAKTEATTKSYTYPIGTDTLIAGLELHFKEEAGVNQSACESAEVKVKLVLTGSGT
jgi:hypothetical protein